MRTKDQYKMGPTRPHHFPAPSSIEFTEYNGHQVCANPSGVPAKWLPIYLELASRMYEDGPRFNIGKDNKDAPTTCRVLLNDQWMTFTDPLDVAIVLGIGLPKPAPKPPAPKAKPSPKVGSSAQILSARNTHVADDLPSWAQEWLDALVYEPKREYARQFLAHLLNGAPMPADPATEWAEKARARAQRLARAA